MSEVVNKNAAVYDAGNTFSFSPDGSKLITSPELTDIIGKDNQPMKAGAQDNLMYIHTKDSFVVATQTEGYVYGDCKLNTARCRMACFEPLPCVNSKSSGHHRAISFSLINRNTPATSLAHFL